jgi:hypothetical protein
MTDEPATEPRETGYHRIERELQDRDYRQGVAVGAALGAAAFLTNPFGWLFDWLLGWGGDDDDGEPPRDYSRAEYIPEEYR